MSFSGSKFRSSDSGYFDIPDGRIDRPLPTSVNASQVPFEILASRFDTNPEYIKTALRNKGLEINCPDDVVEGHLVSYIHYLFSAARKLDKITDREISGRVLRYCNSPESAKQTKYR